MMNVLKWFYFLSKRLYKKWMFILLICLVPLSVTALKLTSDQRSGFVQVAIVNLSGDTGDKIIKNLIDDKSIMRCTVYENTEAAIAELSADRLDAVWVLPPNIENRVADFVKHPSADHYIVEVIKKEDNLKSRLALEKLSGAIYPISSRAFFLKCIREDPDLDLAHLTDAQIYKYYDDHFDETEFFKFSFPDGGTSVKHNEQNYMTSPVRGLLSAVVLLAGLAAAMLFLNDEKRGVFSFAKSAEKLLISFSFELTAIVNIFVFVLCSVYILGVNTHLWREAAISLIFVINTALFCTVLCALIKSVAVLAPLSVLITVLDVYICPIFFDYYVQKIPQFFLPNAYYINSVHNDLYLKYSLIYSAVLLGIMLGFYLKKRKE